MHHFLGAAVVFFGLSTGPLAAQHLDASGNLTFNYFSISGFTVSDTYTIGPDFAEENGVEIPLPFRVAVPRRAEVEVAAVLPDNSAFIGFNFSLATDDGSDGAFLENIQFLNATIPMNADAEDPVVARVAAAAGLLEGQVFPWITGGYDNAELLTLQRVLDPPVPGMVHMIILMDDPNSGQRILARSVVIPHPDQEASYLLASTVNLDLVAANDLETLLATMTGKIIDSFEFLPE